MISWHRPHGSLADDSALVRITPENSGWTYSGMQVLALSAGQTQVITLKGEEGVIVPLSISNVTVDVDGETFFLAGRTGVFAAVSDWLYAPVDSTIMITATTAGEIAICTARASTKFPVAYVPAESVSVEVRGSGQSTRQVTNIATPDSFTAAHKINVCEVITPGGNWSSWPPHRHDGIDDCPTTNEEIYYFRIGKGESPHGDPEGEGLFHVYTVSGSVDETVTLHDGDVYLVPEGYHGPSVAPPEYPMYFLNVLAGPDEDRSMAFCDDPSHHWIRQSWTEQEQDPRLPWTAATGRVTGGTR